MAGRTMLDTVWTGHAVAPGPGVRALLYVDRHLVHEGSFHAFEPRLAGLHLIAAIGAAGGTGHVLEYAG